MVLTVTNSAENIWCSCLLNNEIMSFLLVYLKLWIEIYIQNIFSVLFIIKFSLVSFKNILITKHNLSGLELEAVKTIFQKLLSIYIL